MSDHHAAHPLAELPEGWRWLGQHDAAGLTRELEREISADHPLAGIGVQAVAACLANDDVLYRHVADPARFTVVHLTWSSQRERTPHFPSIEFDGTFAAFLEQERRHAAERDGPRA